ncbi:MAG: phosphopantetheine-binding protein [Bacilli bacterium]|jgi:acyl carrier protein|nr:phosphopantetheine-binding protein [Bacilli bacterium]
MTREEITAKIAEIVRINLPGYEDVPLEENTRINNEAGVDSMTFVYVMCKIEAQFGISIPKRTWDKMLTLGDVVNAVEKELAKK